MGLLDFNLDNLDSPGARMGLGLLAAAGPQAVPMSFGQRLAGAMGQLRAERAAEEERKARQQAQAMQAQMLQLQLEQAKRQKDLTQRRDNYLGALDPNAGPTIQPTMAGAMAAGLSPQEFAALNPQPNNMLGKIDPKDYTPESFGEFMRTGSVASLRAAPKEQTPDEFERALRLAGIDPASALGRQLATERAKKMATHQPAVQNINYGTPMPAINPATGKVELVRPDNKGGMSFTGVEPPPQNRDTKLPAEIQRMNIAADSMVSLLGDYEKWLAKNNPRDPTVQMSPARRAEMQSLMKNIQLQYKELAALGALAGPDLALMEAALTDPFTFKGAWYGPSGLRSQIAQARNLVDVRRKAIGSNSGGQQQQAQPANDDPLGLRK